MKAQVTAAEVFLTWLSARGRDPAATAQADIDAYWLTHGIHHQQAVRAFLIWAIGQSHLPRLDVPVQQFAKGQALTPEQRSACSAASPTATARRSRSEWRPA